MHGRLLTGVIAMAVAAVVLLAPGVAQGATFTVNNAGDGGDVDLNDPTCDADAAAGEQRTLRACIQQLNFLNQTGNILAFDSSLTTLTPGSPYDPITVPLNLNGAVGGNDKIEIDGTNAGANADGLTVNVSGANDDVTITNVNITNFGDDGLCAQNGQYTFRGIYSHGNGGDGLHLMEVANNSTIGGSTAADRNFWSGNAGSGMTFASTVNTTGLVFGGNVAGLNRTGTSALPNAQFGFQLDASSLNLANTGGAANFFTGNTQGGFEITGSNNITANNVIGFLADFITVVGNGGPGVSIPAPAANNVIGTGTQIAGNTDGVNLQANNRISPLVSIFNNTSRGIRRSDPGNFPTANLTNVVRIPSLNDLQISGNVAAPSGQTRLMAFYANRGSDPLGRGERFLGSQNFSNPQGNTINFTINVQDPGPDFNYVTATSTGTGTSEFSPEAAISAAADSTQSGANGAAGSAVGAAPTPLLLPFFQGPGIQISNVTRTTPLNRRDVFFNYLSPFGGPTDFGGSVNAPGTSRLYRFRRVRRNITANVRTRIRLRIPRKAYRAMRRAFRRGRKKAFRVRITAKVAGQTGRGTVRLSRPTRRR